MRWIWITGSASGLGRHLTTELVNKGYSILATDINMLALDQAINEEQWPTEQVTLAALDITELAQWQALFKLSVAQGKQFSHLLNIAGFIEPSCGYKQPSRQIEKHININLMGIVNGCDTLLPHFQQSGAGHIINIASLAGIAPVPGVVAYSTSKAAVRSFSNGLAMELKLDNIPVNVTCVCPDLISTPMMEKQLTYGDHSKLVFSGGKALTVEQVGQLILGPVWRNKTIEVAIPFKREWQVRLTALFPNRMMGLYRYLANKGRRKLRVFHKQ
ncbi:SDR family oxidoreductase [Moritella sp.]|uniref:SDR family NAD(P)-dependent oxidoreductase n=1 Tax=Moritella sp. TaxID=78556 RepID=UPI0025D46C4C|nr:SDR family oxidoreductase [Moritella sp.]